VEKGVGNSFVKGGWKPLVKRVGKGVGKRGLAEKGVSTEKFKNSNFHKKRWWSPMSRDPNPDLNPETLNQTLECERKQWDNDKLSIICRKNNKTIEIFVNRAVEYVSIRFSKKYDDFNDIILLAYELVDEGLAKIIADRTVIVLDEYAIKPQIILVCYILPLVLDEIEKIKNFEQALEFYKKLIEKVEFQFSTLTPIS